ncbi:MAG: Hsp20 family protein [Acidobacteriota bacterium]
MKPQATMTAPVMEAVNPKIVKSESLLERTKKIYQEIERRAYEFFEKRGFVHGNDVSDWLFAEKELLRPIPIELKEEEKELILRAELPGFKADDLEISIETNRVIINGKTERESKKELKKLHYSEFHTKEIFRSIDLPLDVKPAEATAVLKDGVLTLTLPKAAANKPVHVEVKTLL